MDQIALVKENNKIIGWIGFEDLTGNTIYKCYQPISGDIIFSSDTPLLKAIHTVCSGGEPVHLVLKNNEFIKFFFYNHFYKLPFRMCLFALLLDLEQ